MKTPANLSDQEIISLYLNGNTESFTSLVQCYKDRIYTSIYLLVKDHYVAEDIFQETFIRIIDTINSGRYNEEGKFLSWAVRIAYNLCMDHFRKFKRNPSAASNTDTVWERMDLYETGADEKMVKEQRYGAVRKLLERLPDDQREVIIMRHYADLSFKEIATLTNCSINTALGRMRYGLINLRKMMGETQMAAA